MLDAPPHITQSNNRFGLCYTRRRRFHSNGNEETHTIPLPTDRGIGRLRSQRSRRTSYIPQIRLLRRFENLIVPSCATTQKRASRSRRTNFSSLLPNGYNCDLNALRDTCHECTSGTHIREYTNSSLLWETSNDIRKRKRNEIVIKGTTTKEAHVSQLPISANNGSSALEPMSRLPLNHSVSDEQKRDALLHDVQVHQHMKQFSNTYIDDACLKTLQHAFRSDKMLASTSYGGEKGTTDKSTHVPQLSNSSNIVSTVLEPMTQLPMHHSVSANQEKDSLLHDVQVREHMHYFSKTYIDSACLKTLEHAFRKDKMVASTSCGGEKGTLYKKRLPLNQLLASRNCCPTRGPILIIDQEREATLLREVEVYEYMKKAYQTATRNVRRKNNRATLTREKMQSNTTVNSAARRLARSRQTSEQREVERSQNTIRRRNARNGRNDISNIVPRQLQNEFSSHTLTNAQKFRKSCQELVWVSCPECRIKFPDIQLSGGICTNCDLERRRDINPHMFSASNLMDPGVVPVELSRLSNLEQILIARIHPMMSVYRVKGQQYKYSGNVINFEQDVNSISTVLPVRPIDLSAILIVKRTGPHASKEFRVRREFVRQALIWLKNHHIYYRDIQIDDGCLGQLPIDGIPEDIPHATDNNEPAQEEESEGPPEIGEENVYIDEFRAVGTLAVAPQPNQQTCIEKVLQVQDAETTIAQMPFTKKVIDEFSTQGYISMAFPTLFPYGNADLRQARPRKIQPSEYFKYLMKFHDGRFAKDSRFRYFAWNSVSRWRALALGDVYVKKNPEDGELSIQDIQNMLSSGDRQVANRISYYAKSIRGARAYWYTRLKELTAMVKQLGPPTLFFTLSAADMQWPELMHLLDSSNDLHNLSSTEQARRRAKLLNDNPAIAAWFLQTRVAFFFKYFLNDEFSVIDHWFRYEWQNRGSGHVHGFLWLKDSPNVSQISTSEEVRREVIAYFDNLVCIQNPDLNFSNPIHPCARFLPVEVNLDTDDDDYASLVNWVMRHTKCGTYCMRLHKTTKQMVCRFKFPFDVLDNSKIIEEPPSSKMFRFMGCRNDPLLGSHNRKVLQTWRANIDWSPVLSVQSVVNYIAKYAAKAEPSSKSFTDTLRGILTDLRRPCHNIRSAIKRLLIKSVSERDISAQEVCHLLMGYPLTHSSRKIILLNVSENNMMSTAVRRRKCDCTEDADVGTDYGFVTRYLQRPSKYVDTSLYNMAQKHYFRANCWHDYRTDAIVRVVPEIDGEINLNSERWESFCRQQVLLHHHYHSLDEAKGQFDSWAEQYINLGFSENQQNILPEPIDDDFEDELQTNVGMEREEWMMAASIGPEFCSADDVELGMRDFDISHNWEEGFQRYPNIDIERKFVHNNLRGVQELGNDFMNNGLVRHENLSDEQTMATDLIIKSLQDRMPIQLIVCGGAGTGKSTLISAIVKQATTVFGNKKVIRIMAPTGVAAFNIGGATIHHELSISADRRPSQPYQHISGDLCRRMQDDFKDTKLIIIDEYSMLGRGMLANIDLRCRDIFANNNPFGGVSVVLVGDLRQLPPVFDSPLYAGYGNDMQQYGGIAYTGFGKCVRLSQIFRQAGVEQTNFREALQRLSDGTSTIEDWHLFKSRDITLLDTEELHTFKYALRLFPTKQAAHDYNCRRLIDLGKPIARVNSKNNCETASHAVSDDAKGLEKVLYLSVGARVMLRANLSTHYGLVNGAMGTIVDIVYASECGSPLDIPLAIMVDFDNYRGLPFRTGTNIIPITPHTTNWKTSTGTTCTRTQLPIVLCWAITVHKSQGLTLDRAVVDIGERESLGLTFVALSRTRKLSDLAFSPMFTFERLQRIGKCAGLQKRLQEEERLRTMSTTNMSLQKDS